MSRLVTLIILLTLAAPAHALTTRTVQLAAPGALVSPSGAVLAGVPVTWQLVDKYGKPSDGWDAQTGERIGSTAIVATTDANGRFSVALWPTSRGIETRYYKVSVAGLPDVLAPLDAGDGSALSWISFKSAGATLTPIGNSVFANHTGDDSRHLTGDERAGLNAVSTPISAANPPATAADLSAGGYVVPATDVVAGTARLSAASANPADPIVVGDNDARLHAHSNKAVIDGFSVVDGSLLHDGSPIEGGGGAGHTIIYGGSAMTQRTNLELAGPLLTVTDNGSDRTVVTSASAIDGNIVSQTQLRTTEAAIPSNLAAGKIAVSSDTNKVFVGTGASRFEITNQATGAVAAHEGTYSHANIPTTDQKESFPAGATALNKLVLNNDSRLSNSRTPTTHASSHVTGGSDVIANASGSAAGLMSPSDKTKLDGLTAGTKHTITDEGGAGLTARTKLNFTGALVAATDNPGADATDITISNPAIANVTGLQTTLDGKQAALGYTPENVANKGQANGYAPLNAFGKVDSGYLPSTTAPTWGTITGTLSAQTDLNAALAGKSATTHDHSGTYQPLDQQLTDVAGLTPASNAFVMGNGTNFTTTSGASARTALGLGDSATKNVGTTLTTVAAGVHDHPPTIYLPASVTTSAGTVISGTAASMATKDGVYYQVQEGTGSPALTVITTYTGVTGFNMLVGFGRYQGGAGHEMSVELYNYNTTLWDRIQLVGSSTSDAWYSFPVFDAAPYISGGTVQTRFYHVQSGVASHYLYLDYVSLQQVVGSGSSGVTDHGALTGRSVADQHPISAVTSLQTTLDTKAPLSSPALTGAPTAPTAAEGTNTTQIATTEFVNLHVNDPTAAHAASAISYGATTVDARLGELDSEKVAKQTVVGWQWLQATVAASAYDSNGYIYAGIGAVIKKSLDGGLTWTTLKAFSSGSEIRSMFVAANGYIYASPYGTTLSASDAGLWRSVDNGANWTRVLTLSADGAGNYESIWGIDEDSTGIIYAGVYNQGTVTGAKIHRSTDNGANWTLVFDQPAIRHIHDVKVDKLTDTVYVAVGDMGGSNSLYKSTNGTSYSLFLTTVNQITAIGITPTARLFGTDYRGTMVSPYRGYIYRTTDDTTATITLDVHYQDFFFIKRNPNTGHIYAGGRLDGAVVDPYISRLYISRDDGLTWSVVKSLDVQLAVDGFWYASEFYDDRLIVGIRRGGGAAAMSEGVIIDDSGEQPVILNVNNSREVTLGDGHTHIGGKGAAIAEGALSFTDVTTNNASSTKHGLLPKLSNDAGTFLDGTGVFSTPALGTDTSGVYVASVTANGGLTVTGSDDAASVGITPCSGNNKLREWSDATGWGTCISTPAGSGSTPAGTVAGAIQFRNADGSALDADDTIVIDKTNRRLGVGIASPVKPFHLYKSGADVEYRQEVNGDFFPYFNLRRTGGTTKTNSSFNWTIGSSGNLTYQDTFAHNVLVMHPGNNNTYSMYLHRGNVGIGVGNDVAPTYRLDVKGAYLMSNPVFTGSGRNDLVSGQDYTGSTVGDTYTVQIDATGTPDTFQWRKNAGAWTTGVAITGASQTLTDGVKLYFSTTTGHTLNDQWVLTVATPDLLRIRNHSNADVMAATSAGNIGIGTTSPTAKLSVSGGISGRPFGTALTADTTLTAEQMCNGQLSNYGATSTVTATLGSSAPTHECMFVATVSSAYEFRLDPDANTTIHLNDASLSAADGKYLSLGSTIGNQVVCYTAITGAGPAYDWFCRDLRGFATKEP